MSAWIDKLKYKCHKNTQTQQESPPLQIGFSILSMGLAFLAAKHFKDSLDDAAIASTANYSPGFLHMEIDDDLNDV